MGLLWFSEANQASAKNLIPDPPTLSQFLLVPGTLHTLISFTLTPWEMGDVIARTVQLGKVRSERSSSLPTLL